MTPWMNLAAAAGGAAARVAVDRATNWLAGPSYNFGPMRAALPVTPVARGRARGRGRGRGSRRGRGRGRPQVSSRPGSLSSGISTASGSTIVIKDTEILGSPTGSLQVFTFNPGPQELVRLKQFESMYNRYRIKYINIAFKSGSSISTSGNVAFGINVGTKLDGVKDQATIMKLRPFVYIPVWKSETLNVGTQIDSQKYMYCGLEDNDSVAFTLYVFGTKDSGMLQVSYEIEFAYPKPF